MGNEQFIFIEYGRGLLIGPRWGNVPEWFEVYELILSDYGWDGVSVTLPNNIARDMHIFIMEYMRQSHVETFSIAVDNAWNKLCRTAQTNYDKLYLLRVMWRNLGHKTAEVLGG